MLLENKNISLRALETEDIDLLYKWENNTEIWEVSQTQVPFSKYVLRQYLEVAHHDIYVTKQLRLVIENAEKQAVGLVDLFDFEPYHLRTGVGIFIHKHFGNRGYASEALGLLKNYVKQSLGLHQLYANIQAHNEKSLALFQKQGFVAVAVKQDWLKTATGWENEILLQCIL